MRSETGEESGQVNDLNQWHRHVFVQHQYKETRLLLLRNSTGEASGPRSEQKRREGFKQWKNCMRLAWVLIELGGYFYTERPQACKTWRVDDTLTRQITDGLSSYCIGDQCFDGLTHPKSGNP